MPDAQTQANTAIKLNNTGLLYLLRGKPQRAKFTGADNMLQHFGLLTMYNEFTAQKPAHSYSSYVQQLPNAEYSHLPSSDYGKQQFAAHLNSISASLTKLAREAAPKADLPPLMIEEFTPAQLKSAFTLLDGGVPPVFFLHFSKYSISAI